jgi:hypothetical protein
MTPLEAVDGVPLPAEFTALTRKRWVTPTARSRSDAKVAVLVPSANVAHDEPALVENSTT